MSSDAAAENGYGGANKYVLVQTIQKDLYIFYQINK